MKPTTGLGDVSTGRGRSHLCWSFTEIGEFAAKARAFLAEGLADGKRVCLIAPGGVDELTDHLRALPGFDALRERGAVHVRSPDGMYGADAVDPVEQVRAYSAETDAAVAAGFTGLRVAAEVSHLVDTPARLDAFAEYEHIVDRYMAVSGFDALCAYDAPRLGAAAVERLAALHPRGNVDTVPFHLHGWGDGGAVVLDGDVDLAAHDLFPWALDRAAAHWGPGEVVIDARGLEFIDHHGLLRLAELAGRRGLTIVLRTSRFSPARVVEALRLDGVRVERAA
ncbi:MEDS domain-containing protein [Actinokineospora auranticolor]|uniref:Anti-anti-sigma regulatory factor n=1 Tax=Actinokineospora auranticolor TaxID=155976 RepID=A0A2S6GSP8_9PSEU|nr:MEDS domain-containing protein [Actinokineospora auranticolor]PPK68278.1 anti-anti-sigma regulatory factor [Actinokineospora auranticolor]